MEILKYKGFKIKFNSKTYEFSYNIKKWTPIGRGEPLNNGNYLYESECVSDKNLQNLLKSLDNYLDTYTILESTIEITRGFHQEKINIIGYDRASFVLENGERIMLDKSPAIDSAIINNEEYLKLESIYEKYLEYKKLIDDTLKDYYNEKDKYNKKYSLGNLHLKLNGYV
jgi:hypothetical protein